MSEPEYDWAKDITVPVHTDNPSAIQGDVYYRIGDRISAVSCDPYEGVVLDLSTLKAMVKLLEEPSL